MNIGDFVKSDAAIHLQHRPARQCGIIISFDTDNDPVVRWFFQGKTWDEENFRRHIIVCSSVNKKGNT